MIPTDTGLQPIALTPWRMFLNADRPVQAVMVVLLLASILTWTILLAKSLEMLTVRRRLTKAMQMVRGNHEPNRHEPNRHEPNRHEQDWLQRAAGTPVAAAFANAAIAELDASRGLPLEGAKDRIALCLRRLEGSMTRRLQFGTGILASIGSCAPFIGLLGTVWGIMNSFVGISQAHATNLAVVAPGIAEALLTTACGLLAAIPAVLTYNLLARLLAGYRAGLGDLAALVLTHASRQVDQQHAGVAEPRPAIRLAVAE